MTHHYIEHRSTPISYMAVCRCGWSFETKRKQNAFARAGKIKAAVARHLAEKSA